MCMSTFTLEQFTKLQLYTQVSTTIFQQSDVLIWCLQMNILSNVTFCDFCLCSVETPHRSWKDTNSDGVKYHSAWVRVDFQPVPASCTSET